MDIDAAGIAFLKREEGVRNHVYRDSRGLPTVGVGHLIRPEDNLAVGDVITDEQVDDFLQRDLAWVRTALALVTAPLTQNQYDALTSLVYNIGAMAFEHSTVFNDLNAGDYDQAADAFLMWKNAGGRPVLLARREREKALFETPDATAS
jgi:lysozyme